MTNPLERALIGGGILLVVSLLGLTAYLGYQRYQATAGEEAAGATRVAGLAPTWTADARARTTAMPAVSSPAAARTPTTPAAAATAGPAATTAATATAAPSPSLAPRPASPTSASAVTPAASTTRATSGGATPTPGRSWIGNQPLPSAPVPVNGPVLQRMQENGRPGVRTDQAGLGQEIQDRFLAAMAAEDRAFEMLDGSQLDEFFTGEALADLQSRMAKAREVIGKVGTRSTRTHRMMQFIPKIDGSYQLTDALTQRIDAVLRLPDGRYGQVVRAGEEQRNCVVWLMVQENGRWKLSESDMLNGGAEGGLCPPGWS